MANTPQLVLYIASSLGEPVKGYMPAFWQLFCKFIAHLIRLMTDQPRATAKDIILKCKNWVGYLWSARLFISLCMLAGIAAGVCYAMFKKPVYTGKLTFVLYADNKASGISALASQFGLDINMGSNGAFDGDNITGLLGSQRIIIPAIFKSPSSSQPTLLNTFVKSEGLIDKWQAKDRLKNHLPFPAEISDFDGVQDSLLVETCDYILKHNLLVDKTDKKLNYYRVQVTTHDPILSSNLVNFIVREASDFYIQTKTRIARQNLLMLTHEADSLSSLLHGIIVNNAVNTDINLNPAFQVARAPLQQGQVKMSVISTAYGEVVKNLEIAKIALQKETPLYQVIDAPILPLRKQKPSFVISLLAGAFGACFIAVLLVLIKKMYYEVMAS